MKTIKLGKYKHYRNSDNQYEVLGVVWDAEEKVEKVLYRALHDIPELGGFGILFVRSIDMFFSDVEVGGNKVQRFSFVE